MGYAFETKANAKFRFVTNQNSSEQTTLDGINATLPSATTICDGVSSLMAIGGNNPYFDGKAYRTVTDNVYNDD